MAGALLQQKNMVGIEEKMGLVGRWLLAWSAGWWVCVLVASSAWAADCGSRQRPSRDAACTCQPKAHKATIRQQRRRSARLCWQQALQKAKAACQARAPRHKFSSKRGRLTRRFCTISYQCTRLRTKQRGARLSRRVFRKRGRKKIRFKYRIGRRRRPCVAAARKLRKRQCRPSLRRHPVGFTWRKKSSRVKLLMGYKNGHCVIGWTCRYKKKTPIYWCQ